MCMLSQPCQSLILTENVFDFLLRIRMRLWSVVRLVRGNPTLQQHLQDTPGDIVVSLLQVHKTKVDWMGKLP